MIASKNLVFVYGTLRLGGSNHFRMRGARFVTAAKVPGKLYRIDWYPGLVLKEEGMVTGEIYQVEDPHLQELDVFEGVSAAADDGEYRRIRVAAEIDGAHCDVWVWEWMGAREAAAWIPGGDWLAED